MKQYSIAEARDGFTGIVRSVEDNGPVELTRRGEPVAVLVSAVEYQRLIEGPVSFKDAYDQFRQEYDLASLDIDPSIFDGERDRSPGREAVL